MNKSKPIKDQMYQIKSPQNKYQSAYNNSWTINIIIIH